MAWNQKIMQLSAALDERKIPYLMPQQKKFGEYYCSVHKPNDEIICCTECSAS
jgi:hypothetical protein